MNGQKRIAAAGAPLLDKGMTLHEYIEVFMRRKWWFILAILLGTGISILYSYTLRPIYRSSTLILVDPQKVPLQYVSTTVTVSPDEKLRTLAQLITSRTNLAKIIREFGLYKPEEKPAKHQAGFFEQMQNKFEKFLTKVGLGEKSSKTALNPDVVAEETVETMRKDIEIKVSGKESFAVAYMGKDPNTVMRVTNTLALLFMEEHLKGRERQAEGTSDFLQSQLEEIERELQKQEQALREFKQTARGQLPTQLETNLRTLERLQLDANTAEAALRAADLSLLDVRNKTIDEQKKQQEMANMSLLVGESAAPGPLASGQTAQTQQRLEALKQELAKLRATFNENYPDIALVRQQIDEITQASGSASESTTGNPPRQPSAAPANATSSQTMRASQQSVLQNLETSKVKLEREIEMLKVRRKKIDEQIGDYHKRVEAIPANEERLADLTRDYNITLKNYQTLLEKRLNAKISENLEKKQKGEQFKILDPANLPTKPYSPNRPLIIGMGSIIGGGLGIGLILLGNFLGPAFRKPEDFLGVSDVPVLVTIPRYKVLQKNGHNLVSLTETDSIATEQYRVLYTKLNDLSKAGDQKIFAVSSAVQSEGKTITVLNLAIVMARDFGRRTLVIEGDLRRPTIPLYMNTNLEEGLVDILSSKTNLQSTLVPLANALVPFVDENLCILPAAKRIQNSSNLLSSQRAKDLLNVLRERYEFILIDAPPILPLSDMNIFEEVVDGILMVVRAERTPRGAYLKALEVLGTDKIVGIVLNDVRPTFSSYYNYGYKYKYTYGYKTAVG